MYVVIEGGEGTGKTTLVEWLVKNLRLSELPVCSVREPPDSKLGKVAIDYFKGGGVDPRVAACLMTAARIDQHLWIEATGGFDDGPSGFDSGVWISDRSFLSTFVYQSEVGIETLLHMHGWKGPTYPVHTPDLLICLDVDPEEAVRRVRQRGSEHLSDDQVRRFALKYREVMEYFKSEWNFYSDVAVVVDANRPFGIVAEEVRQLISQKFAKEYPHLFNNKGS